RGQIANTERDRMLGAAGDRPNLSRLRYCYRSNRKTRSAPATGDGVRIVDPERRPDEVVDEVDLRPGHVHQRYRVDQHGCAIPFDDYVVRLAFGHKIEFVLKTGAATTFDAHAQQLVRGLVGHDLVNAARGICG